MANDRGTPAAGQGDSDRGAVRVNNQHVKLNSVKKTLSDYQQYSDITVVATLQDYARVGMEPELNERPAFPQDPGSVARLIPEKSKERLLTYVMEQYS